MECIRRIGFSVVLLFAVAGGASATGFSIGGQVQKPTQLSANDLRTLPPTNVTVSMLTEHGQESGTYTGALLWTLLANAQFVEEPKGHLRHTILVTGSDDYTVAIAVGELDPNFEGKKVIIAYAKDGKPFDIDDGLRLIVPGDKHGGRAVKNVVHIEVK